METRGEKEGEGASGESHDNDPSRCEHFRKDAITAQCRGTQTPLRILDTFFLKKTHEKKLTKPLPLLLGRANRITVQHHGTILQSDSSRG